MITITSFLYVLLIGISLSMDAFSLSLVYGISGISKKDKIIISIIVGIYHFFMPLIGQKFGNIINSIPFLSINIISFIILIYLGIELIISKDDSNLSITSNYYGYLFFGLSVSIDSLIVGVSLNSISSNYILSACVFMIVSCAFTFTGLNLGNIVGHKLGRYSKLIGGIILIILSFVIFIIK